MPEILCAVAAGGEAAAMVETCEPTARVARKRRMDIRRYRIGIAPGAAAAEKGNGGKRMRKAIPGDSSVRVLAGRVDVGGDAEGNGLGTHEGLAAGLNTPKAAAGEVVEEKGMVVERCPGYGMTSVCGRRREMEDAVSIRPGFLRRGSGSAGFHFFGVFDGHGCSHVAVSCKNRMHELLAEEVAAGGVSKSTAEWKGVMERSFARMDSEVLLFGEGGADRKLDCGCELQTTKCDHVGSTAVVAVVSAEEIVVANCGDSRAVLCRGGVPVPLSDDHKPDRPDELQRIEDAGGRVIYWDGARVLGVLAMSRAIGDNHLKPFVIPDPEVTVTERSDADEFLILASDGLWDVVSNATACDVVRMCLNAGRGRVPVSPEVVGKGEERGDKHGGSDKACLDAAMLLTKLAMTRRTADNVTVVVVDLRRRR